MAVPIGVRYQASFTGPGIVQLGKEDLGNFGKRTLGTWERGPRIWVNQIDPIDGPKKSHIVSHSVDSVEKFTFVISTILCVFCAKTPQSTVPPAPTGIEKRWQGVGLQGV